MKKIIKLIDFATRAECMLMGSGSCVKRIDLFCEGSFSLTVVDGDSFELTGMHSGKNISLEGRKGSHIVVDGLEVKIEHVEFSFIVVSRAGISSKVMMIDYIIDNVVG